MLEKKFIMRIDESDLGKKNDLVYPIYIDEKTGYNVCYLPMAKVKFYVNYDLSGQNEFEWLDMQILIEQAIPVLKQQRVDDSILKFVCKFPNELYGVKDERLAELNPFFANKLILKTTGPAQDKMQTSMRSYDYKKQLRNQLEEYEALLPYSLKLASEVAVRTGTQFEAMLFAKTLHSLKDCSKNSFAKPTDYVM